MNAETALPAILTLGFPLRYPSPDLSGLHAAAGLDQEEALTASYAVYGELIRH